MGRDLLGVHSNFPPVAVAIAESVYAVTVYRNKGGRTGNGLNGVEISGLALAEDEGGGRVVRRRVGDGVRLAGNDTLGRELVDLEGGNESSESRGGEDGLEEAHGGGLLVVGEIKVLRGLLLDGYSELRMSD